MKKALVHLEMTNSFAFQYLLSKQNEIIFLIYADKILLKNYLKILKYQIKITVTNMLFFLLIYFIYIYSIIVISFILK